MFTSSGQPISIDNMPACLHEDVEHHRPLLQEYLRRIKQLVRLVALFPDQEHEEFKRVRTFLLDGCPEGHGWIGLAIDVGSEGTLEVQQGFLSTIRRASAGGGGQRPITRMELKSYLTDLLKMLPDTPKQDADHTANYGFGVIDPSFCAKVVEAFSAGLHAAEADAFLQGVGTVEPPASAAVEPLAVEMPPLGSGRLGRQEAYVTFNNQRSSIGLTAPQQEEKLAKLREAKLTSIVPCALLLHTRLQQVQTKLLAESPVQTKLLAESPVGYRLEQLTCRPPWPQGVDPACREESLSQADFVKAFGMGQDKFKALKAWRKNELKKKAGLF